MALDPATFVSKPAPGRDCGTCTLCCKVFDVPVLEKKAGEWCSHCLPGKGCAIHATRPDHCRAFHCFWMLAPFLGPEWKPEKAKFVITIDPATQFMLVQVDPAQAGSWKREPYYSQFKKWSLANLQRGRQVVVFVNKAATVILPNKDVPLGEIGPDERIFITKRPVLGGFDLEAEKRKA
ncbi:MAG: hypothetical protein LCH61_20085 [Proteobacteria bacterium]|nr:hypothetical protein [Pseudomonadota bacterium]